MRRVSVVGNSGSGRSRLAARIAAGLAVPHVELDALYHLAGWQPADPAELLRQARYRSAMASPTCRHLTFVHLRSHAEATRWLRALRSRPA
jgi:cytidylate kinase